MQDTIHIIGGGLAGTEAAWQVARRGAHAVLHEMRPVRRTPAHQTDRLAELVCSNSLKSEQENTAPWLLKEELRRLDSLLLEAARKARVPGGHALTVDRGDLRRRSHRGHCVRAAHRTAARRSHRHSRGRHRRHRHRPAHQRRAGAGYRAAHRLRPPVLLRQHQPHRGSRYGRYRHRVLGLALRQVDRRHRRLPELPLRPRAVRTLRRRTAGGGGRPRAHRREDGRRSSRRACPSKSWRGAAATRCASAP